MQAFVYQAVSQRIVFAAGAIATLGEEIDRMGARRALILSTPGQSPAADALRARHSGRIVARFGEARPHTPITVTERALSACEASQTDLLITYGGGSATGLGKALAARTGLALLAIPTSYAGSEATPILGETGDSAKLTRRLPEVLPRTVLYDPELTFGLPPAVTAASGLNALAHAIEALYAPDASPPVSALALSGIELMIRALPIAFERPENLAARSDALYAAWACGTCLGTVSMGLHHKICHVLGGQFNLPHDLTHSVVLPYVLDFNRDAAAVQLAPIAQRLGSDDLAGLIWDLARSLGLPASLADIGMPVEGLEPVIAELLARPYANPRPLDHENLSALLRAAFAGTRPAQLS